MNTVGPSEGKRKKHARYLFRLIWLSCMSVCIPIILAGVIYHQLSVPRLISQFQENSLNNLQSAKNRVEGIMNAIELEAWQLSNSPAIRDSFSKERFNEETMVHLDMIQMLGIKKSANAAIDEIIYYNDISKTIISSDQGYVLYAQDYPDLVSDIDSVMKTGREAGWVYLPSAVRKGNLTFVYLMPHTNTGNVKGAIIIHVKEGSIADELRDDSAANKHTAAVVLDLRGTVLLSTANKQMLGLDMTAFPVYGKILRKNDTSGIEFNESDEQGKTVNFFLKTVNGRTYIASLPEEEISKQLQWIELLILYTMSILVAVGIIMSVITSRLAYSPIDKLIHQGKRLSGGNIHVTSGNEIDYIASCLEYLNEQSRSLNSYVQKIEPTLQELFLRKLIKREMVQLSTILDESRSLRIPENRLYLALVVVLENTHQESRFLPGEYPIMTFAIINVMTELLQKAEGMEGYFLAGDHKEVVALLHVSPETAPKQLVESAERYARTITEALNQYLSFRVSIGIGRPQHSVAQVPTSYQEALLALQFRMYKTPNSVFYIEHEEQRKKSTMRIYPVELEALIVGELGKGDVQQAVEHFREFSSAIRITESYNFIYQCYHVLLSTIVRSLETMGITLIDIVEVNLFDQLKGRQTSEEIVDWFIGVLFPLYSKITEEERCHHALLAVQKVRLHIAERLRDVSLAECAELVGCSPSYLSRLFLRETGCSFIDYVTKCKVDEAKRLLKDTPSSVKEIAQVVGYSERNLNRAFQKWVQKSPKQYRLGFAKEQQ